MDILEKNKKLNQIFHFCLSLESYKLGKKNSKQQQEKLHAIYHIIWRLWQSVALSISWKVKLKACQFIVGNLWSNTLDDKLVHIL